MILEISGLAFGYGSDDTISDLGFSAGPGDLVSVLGPNGVGKTTLLKCINAIHRPKRGSVLVDGRSVLDMGAKETARNVGYVPQRSHTSGSTVFESVMIGRKPRIDVDIGDADLSLVGRVIDLLGLSDIAQKPVNAISGGEYQLVQIARALVQQPRVVLLDEPTSNLDLKNQYAVLRTLTNIIRANDMCAVMTNHDLNQALRYSNRFILMKAGRIFAAGGKEVITSENIREVYGIDVTVAEVEGTQVVVPKEI